MLFLGWLFQSSQIPEEDPHYVEICCDLSFHTTYVFKDFSQKILLNMSSLIEDMAHNEQIWLKYL